jgi:Kef-type K+ transport system membrane component KefB/nucleotide-binding universal stress UspA family protein
MADFIASLPDSPIVVFTILLLVSLTVPPIFERLKLPGLVGLLVAGIILGPYGLNFLSEKTETMKLLSDIGKIYLMFVAGLEIDMEQFKKHKNRSLAFGIFTFAIPLIIGTFVGRMFNFGWNGSILIGSLFASHTLLGYPIIQALGLVQNQAVIVTIGATIFTDIGALLVLAICVSIHGGDFSTYFLALQLGSLAIYSAVILWGFDWLGKKYFNSTKEDEGNQFLFVLVALFVASVGAQVINVDKIVGAFLAGLAINDAVGNSPVKEKIVFIGSVLFIPFFFVNMGLLLNLPLFVESFSSSFTLTLAIAIGLITGKFLAAFFTKIFYKYDFNELMVMWSLSLPQVAATLAAAFVGVRVGLLTEQVFNAVIVLMLITSILGPLITAKFAPKLSPISQEITDNDLSPWWLNQDSHQENQAQNFTIIVPIYKPETAEYLLEMASILVRHENGIIVPASIIAPSPPHMDDPQMIFALQKSNSLLQEAEQICSEFDIEVNTSLRIADDQASGIIRVAREQNASLIIMGWLDNLNIQSILFGNTIDHVLWAAHCPVAVMRLVHHPQEIKRILIPVKIITPQIIQIIRFAQLLADSNQGMLYLLHVCPPETQKNDLINFENSLKNIINQEDHQVEYKIKIIPHQKVSQVIIRLSHFFDLLILRTYRRRTAAGLAVSDVTTEVIKNLRSSLVLFGEPNQ